MGSLRGPAAPTPLVLALSAGASHCSSATPGLASGRTGLSCAHGHLTPDAPTQHRAPTRSMRQREGHTLCPHVKHPEKDVGPRLKAHCQLCRSESDGPKTSLLTVGPPGCPEGALRTAGPTARQPRAEPPRAPTLRRAPCPASLDPLRGSGKKRRTTTSPVCRGPAPQLPGDQGGGASPSPDPSQLPWPRRRSHTKPR